MTASLGQAQAGPSQANSTHETPASPGGGATQSTPRLAWGPLMLCGAVLLAGGLAALLNPFAAALTVTAVAALALLAAGLILASAALAAGERAGQRLMAGLLSALLILFSLSLLADPVAGLVSLTLLTAAFFVAAGALRMLMALQMRDRPGWSWLMAGGAVSVALGALIFVALPGAAMGVLGLFLGVELITSGLSMIALGAHRRADARLDDA